MTTNDIVITPLKKKRPNGEVYTRIPQIEALLVELSSLSRDELLGRAGMPRPSQSSRPRGDVRAG